MSKRRQQQKNVAEARASVFARPAQPSSTPTGLINVQNKTISRNSKESWPGPFATAWDMISKREDAKRRRMESIQNAQEMINDDQKKSKHDIKDEYEKLLSTLIWQPKKKNSNDRSSFRKIKTLNELCIETFAQSPSHLSIPIIHNMNEDSRSKLLLKLAQLRLLNPEILLMFAFPDSNTASIPEGSQIHEEAILKFMNIVGSSNNDLNNHNNEKNSSSHSYSGSKSSNINIQSIQIHNSGLCFSDKVATYLTNHLTTSTLEVLELQGLYRLSDKALSQLLISCQNSLKYLDLSANARFSELSMQVLRFDKLMSLTLNHISHITDEHLKLMFHNYYHLNRNKLTSSSSSSSTNTCSFSTTTNSNTTNTTMVSLESLSLNGLTNITDNGIIFILEIIGSKLQSLSLNYCSQLTDESLISIRCNCHGLRELDLSYITSLTTPSLIGLFIFHPDLLPKDTTLDEDD